MPKKVAVILAGAVAKGAYAAGALQVLAEQGLDVLRLVAASSGALNAVLYASYVRRGAERAGTAELVGLWTDRAGFRDVFALDVASLLRLEGISSGAKVRALLRSHIAPGPVADPRPVSLRILTGALRGIHSQHLDAITQDEDPDALPPLRNRTTYEYVCDFDHRDFDTAAGRDLVIEAALASSAFPVVFTPVELEDRRIQELGPCIDGGAVNNAPIKWALGGRIGDELDAIVVVAPTPELEPRPTEVRGLRLINQAAAMLVNERLYRDLREAERVNARLAALELLKQEGLTDDQLAKVKQALGWADMKQIKILQIRPRAPLRGNSFSAFFSKALREEYIEIGRRCAREVFEAPENRWLAAGEAPEKLRVVP